MKRGKDNEKIMQPMFPRLHVNDKEKGGPRAPPRNKMALYEQLSIPSQRFNPNPKNTASVVPPPASSSQGTSHEGMFFPPHLQRSTHPAGKSYAGYSDFNSPLTPLEHNKKHDEEDFMVPIFVQSEIGQDQRKNSNGIDREDDEPVRGIENGHSSILSRDSCLEELGSPNNPTFESGYHEDNRCESLQIAKGDREDDASETSMVDSIPGLDMSPDDVVGIIGQKQFWKARRAIVNQQRVFAVQVFELHRLIKVQRLIAGSPHLLIEGSAFLGKPLKGSSPKKLPIENVVKPSPHIVKHKDDSRNPNRKMECLAENGVGKTFCSSEQNFSQPSSYRLFSEQGVSPWGFHQPPGHQWLVPVMSPSEGLIYKPYHPGHGLLGPVCRGCGHPGSNPMMGTFVNPAYGFFPSYGMPVINPGISGSAVEQANQPGQLHQSSCNVPTQKNGAISNGVKQPASSESEFLGSTASSSGERAQEFGSKRRNVLTLFPTSPVPAVHFAEGSAELQDTCQPKRVIKVVPRNARSATESAARIFQSIQEERKQCDSF
ncbi:hypothetical protein ACSBR2_037155 [Camellia fascicularis]